MDWQKMFDSAPLATVVLVVAGLALRWLAPRLDRLVDCLIAFVVRTGDLQASTHQLVKRHSGKLEEIHGDVRVVKDGVATLLKRPNEEAP